MKKIMLMTNALYGGGAEKILQTVVSHLDRSKYDVTLYSMHREELDTSLYRGSLTYRAVFDSYRGNSKLMTVLHSLYAKVRGKLFTMLPATAFYRLFIRGTYDVEVAFIEGESTKIVSGSPNRRSKKLVWVHVDLKANPWTAFLYKDDADEAAHYRRFDKVLCVSDGVREAFLTKYDVEPTRTATHYNPIDRETILQRAEEETPLEETSRLRLITVGRLVHQKGYDRLIRCAAQLRREGFDFELYILGEGEERTMLERLVQEHGLQDRVFLPGFQRNPYAWMKRSDVMVCSSRAEGFSTVVTEAVVLGLPVISTDCAGIRELFGEADCGLITENSEEALCDALHEMLAAPEKLESYASESRKRSRDFTLEISMKKLEELLNS